MHFEDITVVIPSIPPRAHLLERAVNSVKAQTLQPAEIIVSMDTQRRGAPHTRQQGLDKVETPWVAFLDDDDEMLPNHLATLAQGALDHGADYVFSWYQVIGGTDPLPHFGREWTRDDPTQTTITTLVRTSLAKKIGFVEPIPGEQIHGQTLGEDFRFTCGISNIGGKIVHIPKRTWLWHHDSGNTSGRPDRW